METAKARLKEWEGKSDDECSLILVVKDVSVEDFNRFKSTYEGHIKLVHEHGDVGFYKLPADVHSTVGVVVDEYLFIPVLKHAFEKTAALCAERGKYH